MTFFILLSNLPLISKGKVIFVTLTPCWKCIGWWRGSTMSASTVETITMTWTFWKCFLVGQILEKNKHALHFNLLLISAYIYRLSGSTLSSFFHHIWIWLWFRDVGMTPQFWKKQVGHEKAGINIVFNKLFFRWICLFLLNITVGN